MPGMGHDFALYPSQAEFLGRRQDTKPHPYDEDVLNVIINWLEEQLRS